MAESSFYLRERKTRMAAQSMGGPNAVTTAWAGRSGLYKKARSSQLKNFTGIDSPYEPPEDPEIRIDTTVMTADEAAEAIIRRLIP
jgi:hypothetical protein